MDHHNTCPACRQEMFPIAWNDRPNRRVPCDWDCPSSCYTVLPPDQWTAAIAEFQREQRTRS